MTEGRRDAVAVGLGVLAIGLAVAAASAFFLGWSDDQYCPARMLCKRDAGLCLPE